MNRVSSLFDALIHQVMAAKTASELSNISSAAFRSLSRGRIRQGLESEADDALAQLYDVIADQAEALVAIADRERSELAAFRRTGYMR